MAAAFRSFRGKRRPRLLLSLHDELLLECDRQDTRAVMQILHTEMTQAVPLAVPLDVVIKTGSSWGRMADAGDPTATDASGLPHTGNHEPQESSD